jgi:hypothetical protein
MHIHTFIYLFSKENRLIRAQFNVSHHKNMPVNVLLDFISESSALIKTTTFRELVLPPSSGDRDGQQKPYSTQPSGQASLNLRSMPMYAR